MRGGVVRGRRRQFGIHLFRGLRCKPFGRRSRIRRGDSGDLGRDVASRLRGGEWFHCCRGRGVVGIRREGTAGEAGQGSMVQCRHGRRRYIERSRSRGVAIVVCGWDLRRSGLPAVIRRQRLPRFLVDEGQTSRRRLRFVNLFGGRHSSRRRMATDSEHPHAAESQGRADHGADDDREVRMRRWNDESLPRGTFGFWQIRHDGTLVRYARTGDTGGEVADRGPTEKVSRRPPQTAQVGRAGESRGEA